MAEADESPVSDDEHGVLAGELVGVLSTYVFGTNGAECAEYGGVSLALVGEASAGAEHVRPFGNAEVIELGDLADAQTFGDEPPGVRGDGERVEAVGSCQLDYLGQTRGGPMQIGPSKAPEATTFERTYPGTVFYARRSARTWPRSSTGTRSPMT